MSTRKNHVTFFWLKHFTVLEKHLHRIPKAPLQRHFLLEQQMPPLGSQLHLVFSSIISISGNKLRYDGALGSIPVWLIPNEYDGLVVAFSKSSILEFNTLFWLIIVKTCSLSWLKMLWFGAEFLFLQQHFELIA